MGAGGTAVDVTQQADTRMGEAETEVVVPVAGVVVVAVGDAAVGSVVVPTAPAEHPVGAMSSR